MVELRQMLKKAIGSFVVCTLALAFSQDYERIHLPSYSEVVAGIGGELVACPDRSEMFYLMPNLNPSHEWLAITCIDLGGIEYAAIQERISSAAHPLRDFYWGYFDKPFLTYINSFITPDELRIEAYIPVGYPGYPDAILALRPN